VKRSFRTRLAVVAAAALGAALVAAGPSLGDSGGNGNGKASGNPHVQGSPTPTPAAASVQGVVQSVSSTGALVRLLDGSTVNLLLGRDTQVVVDGRPSRLNAVRPGYVLVGVVKSGRTTVLRFVRPT